jgi:hypothetical protein
MGPGFGESMGPGKVSAAQTTNAGTADVTASEVHAATTKVTSAEVHATPAKVATAATAVAAAATATASSEGSCWNRRAAQKDSGDSHNHRFFHHERLRANFRVWLQLRVSPDRHASGRTLRCHAGI